MRNGYERTTNSKWNEKGKKISYLKKNQTKLNTYIL